MFVGLFAMTVGPFRETGRGSRLELEVGGRVASLESFCRLRPGAIVTELRDFGNYLNARELRIFLVEKISSHCAVTLGPCCFRAPSHTTHYHTPTFSFDYEVKILGINTSSLILSSKQIR